MERIFDTSSNITIDSLLSILVKQTLDENVQNYYETLLIDSIEINTKEVEVC